MDLYQQDVLILRCKVCDHQSNLMRVLSVLLLTVFLLRGQAKGGSQGEGTPYYTYAAYSLCQEQWCSSSLEI